MNETRGRRPHLGGMTLGVAVACGIWLGLTVATAGAFTPRPAPGRLLLALRDGVLVRPYAAPAAPGQRKTGEPGLDALAAHFGVHAFLAQFPGETHQSKAIAGDDLSRYFVLEFPPSVDLDAIRAAFAADPAVEVAEFDMLQPLLVDADDMVNQWHIENSTGHDAHIPGGWNHSQGSSSVLLAIADSGVDWQHPDLGGTGPQFTDGNIWINTLELNGLPGVDDDANGYFDDVRGWDFVSSLVGAWPGEDASSQDNDPSDFNGHGTHVAGIAGAITDNGIGVAGVGWNCKVMALRIGGSIDDGGTEVGVVLMSAAAAAINYARQKGAVAFNCSWGSSNVSSLSAAVSAAVAQGMVLCVAAGNDNSTGQSYLSFRGDCFDVAATGNGDAKASFSNYGAWVDVSAPGVGIYSTYFNHSTPPFHTYQTLQGTSMAAPIVTGLVGLVKARTPALTGAQIKAAIQSGCDDIDALNPGYDGLLGSGRVNLLRTFGDFNLSVPQDYATFDKALAASGPGDTLALQGGIVITTPMYLWRSDRHILGGWDPTFTTRDPVQNPTLVQVAGGGPALEIQQGIGATLVVDGFSFAGGVARPLSSPLVGNFGGGILCIGASPILRNCRFTYNTAGSGAEFGGGGGGFFSASAAQLVDCTFADNSARRGGGVYVHASNLVLQGGEIRGNTAVAGGQTTAGSGLYVDGGTVSLSGVVIEDNLGAATGGGLHIESGGVVGQGVVLANNAAANGGGNVALGSAATLVLRGSEVRGGAAPFGGGLQAAAGASLTLRSTLVAGNVAAFIGGGLYALGASAVLENVTLAANRGTGAGFDALYAANCPSPWSLRSALVSHHPVAANPALFFSGAAPVIAYTTYFANAGGNGVALGPTDAQADPLYVNAAGDWALGLHSPALDSGDPGMGADPDGSANDRGAYGGPQAQERAPAVPAGLVATRLLGPPRNEMTWDAPPAGIQSMAVYRGATPDFVPGPASYLGSAAAAGGGFTDASGGPGDWYRLAALDASGASSGFTAAVQPADATDAPHTAPARLALHPNEPNPFNPSTMLRYDLHRDGRVNLALYDASGRLVRRLVDAFRPAGTYAVRWDGRDDAGRSVGSGVYVARLEAHDTSSARKLVLIR